MAGKDFGDGNGKGGFGFVNKKNGGAYRDRTDDLLNANQMLSQLS